MKTTIEELKEKFAELRSQFSSLPEFSYLTIRDKIMHQRRKIMYLQSIGSGCYTMQQKEGNGTMQAATNEIDFSFNNSPLIIVGVCIEDTNSPIHEVSEFSNKLLFDCIMNDMHPFMKWTHVYGYGGDNDNYTRTFVLFER